MTDRREAILSRLVKILEGAPGIAAVYRNTAQISENKLPAAAVLDADEAADDRDIGRNHRSNAANIVTMRPEIVVALAASAAEAGKQLNAWRALIAKRILYDDELQTICGHNGSIRYDGCVTAFAVGRSMQGEMTMTFAIAYVFRPSEL